MKRRIRIVSLLLSLVMCSTQCIPAFASSESIGRVSDIPHTTIYMDVRSMTSEERDCAFQNHMSEATAAVLAQHGTRGNLGYTDTNYGSTTRHTVKGYPGDQPPGGYSYGPQGGAVHFTQTGGPTVSISISASIPNYISINIAIPLGAMTEVETGYSCNIPGSPQSAPVYYKVYEQKVVEVTPYVVYWRQTSLDEWQVAGTGEVVETISIRADPVRV